MRMSDWSSDGCSSDLAVRLLEVGAAGFFEPLDAAGGIGQADFGELRVDGAPAALEDAEDVAGRHDVPARQRIEPCKRAALRLAVGQYLVRRESGLARLQISFCGQPRNGRKQAGGLPGARIGSIGRA